MPVSPMTQWNMIEFFKMSVVLDMEFLLAILLINIF